MGKKLVYRLYREERIWFGALSAMQMKIDIARRRTISALSCFRTTMGPTQYHYSHVSTFLIGTSNPKHLQENVGALSTSSLSATETGGTAEMAVGPA